MRRNNIWTQYPIVRLCIHNVNKQSLVKLKATKLIKHKPQEPVVTRKPPRSTAANIWSTWFWWWKVQLSWTPLSKSWTEDRKRVDSEQPTLKYLVIQSFMSKLDDSCLFLSFQVWILNPIPEKDLGRQHFPHLPQEIQKQAGSNLGHTPSRWSETTGHTVRCPHPEGDTRLQHAYWATARSTALEI